MQIINAIYNNKNALDQKNRADRKSSSPNQLQIINSVNRSNYEFSAAI